MTKLIMLMMLLRLSPLLLLLLQPLLLLLMPLLLLPLSLPLMQPPLLLFLPLTLPPLIMLPLPLLLSLTLLLGEAPPKSGSFSGSSSIPPSLTLSRLTSRSPSPAASLPSSKSKRR